MPAPHPTPEESVVASHGVTIDASFLDRLHQSSYRTVARGLLFLGLYGGSAWLAVSAQSLPNPTLGLSLLLLPAYLVAAASLHGISLFTHEAVHGVLSRNKNVNRAFGIICALPVLQNYSAYKVLHLQHHTHLGQEGDPDHYDNYSQWTWLVFSMHWLRLVLGYPVYIVMIPALGWRQGSGSDRRWIVLEVSLLLGLGGVVVMTCPGHILLHAWLIPMLVINTLVNIRGMSQHTFLEESNDPVRGTRSILTNRVTEFFMCGENYHLEHHLFPRVPWHNLRRLHRALKPQLEERDAPFVRSYFEFVREFVRKSWQRSPLGARGRVASRG